MGYVVVVLAMMNIIALGGAGYLIYRLLKEWPMTIETIIQDEVRMQDQRIEKRLQRANRPDSDDQKTGEGLDGTGRSDTIAAGRPMRRGGQ